MEVGEAIATLHILDAELNLPEGLIFILLKVSQVELEHPALHLFRCNLGALRPGDECLAAVTCGEARRSLDIIPLLLEKWIASLLLATLLASLCQALILADCHFGKTL